MARCLDLYVDSMTIQPPIPEHTDSINRTTTYVYAYSEGRLPRRHDEKWPSKKTNISYVFWSWENVVCARCWVYIPVVAAKSAMRVSQPGGFCWRTAPRKRLFHVCVMAGCAQEAYACRWSNRPVCEPAYSSPPLSRSRSGDLLNLLEIHHG